ncbi:MAG: SurA N-terminal domain-containing protein [Methylococcales bacterium]|nr:SurA N-terminal domain-containing protein [Methylococcales bacterium]MDP3839379.1 SurA N-terminal domain-containing protein [Methylococcales bacterium]
MLTKIREKAHGIFAQVLLLGMCVLFGLWGIESYTDSSKETAVASVGDKDFYQRDVNKAYEQYSQQFQGMGIDEQSLKNQALEKLISDEVLLQYVRKQGLVATDEGTRDFIKTLPYFQVNGQFSEAQYKALLNSQRMTSAEFVNRIKNAIIMEQLQGSIINSSFATDYDVESFFKIQNQQRDADYLTVALPVLTEQPSDADISSYYQQHQEKFQIPEQLSVEYVELSLPELASKVAVSDDKLKAFYDEQKDTYTTPERRKISHILFMVNDKIDDKTALEKAVKAQQELAAKDFATVAKEMSEDKLTAKTGGDLGLFNVGAMEKPLEDAATALKLNEVSKPVKSKFGYHLIKVTELSAGDIKPFDSVKDEVTKSYQKAQAETSFYEAGETLTSMSFEHPDSLQAVADTLGLTIKKSNLFTKDKGDGIAAEDKIRGSAFAEEVLQGNNSTPIEVGSDRLVVLRQLEHKEAAARELKDVKADIIAALQADKAKVLAISKAKEIAARLQAGEAMQAVATEQKLDIKKVTGLSRNKPQLPEQFADAIFKAAKPAGDKPSVVIVPMPTGEQVIVSINKVTAGVMSDDDKKKLELAKKNIAHAFGQTEFNAVVNSLQSSADIKITPKATAEQAAE